MIVTLKPAMIAASAVHGRHPSRPTARGAVGVPAGGGSAGNGSCGGAGRPLGCMLVTVASRLRGEGSELGERSDHRNPRRNVRRVLLAHHEDRAVGATHAPEAPAPYHDEAGVELLGETHDLPVRLSQTSYFWTTVEVRR